MRDIWSILLALVFLAGTGTAGMMMDGDGTGMMNGDTGSGSCPMMNADEGHDSHEECEQIMEGECEGFDSEDCQEMHEECEEHMHNGHHAEVDEGEPEEGRHGCSMMGGH